MMRGLTRWCVWSSSSNIMWTRAQFHKKKSVASLLLGHVVKLHDLHGPCAYPLCFAEAASQISAHYLSNTELSHTSFARQHSKGFPRVELAVVLNKLNLWSG